MPKKRRDREGLKDRVFDLLTGPKHVTPMAASKVLKCRPSLVYEAIEEMIRERSLRKLKGTWPPKYGVGLNGSIRRLDAVPEWSSGMGREPPHGGLSKESSSPVLPRPTEPSLPPLPAENPGGLEPEHPPPRVIQLANLQYAAPVIREPDWDRVKMFGWDRNWKACGWDRGWSTKGRARFRRKIIQSKDYGDITVVFCRGPRKFTATVTFDRQPVHAFRLGGKKELHDDVAQSVFKHLAKTMGYGFGLVRQTSQEEWIDAFPEIEDFLGGPFTITAADGTEYRIDKSRGKPESQTRGPRGSEVMEALLQVPDLVRVLNELVPEVRAQSVAMVGVKEALESLVGLMKNALSPPSPAPTEPKKGEDIKGYG